jgi:hypothetical protein
MDNWTGKLFFIFSVAVVLACAAAWLLGWRYRAAMRRLMSAPVDASAPAATVATPEFAALPPLAPVTVAGNRRAGIFLTLLLLALSCLMALSSAALYLGFKMQDTAFSLNRFAVITLVNLWPVIPALSLLWRWSRLQVLGVLLLWCGFCYGVMLWSQIELRPLEPLLYLAIEIGPPLVLMALLFMGSVTRAVAPWLVPVFVGLVFASITSIDILTLLVNRQSPLAIWLSSWLSVNGAILLFTLLAGLLAWWPLLQLGRALGRAYARKQLSELIVLFTAVWLVSLLFQVLSAASNRGLAGAIMLLPLLWIPLAMLLSHRLGSKRGRPPTLLVLRVFQHDAQVQDLFDYVVERWRLSGNTVLIAGTDLMDRTIDADDIFTFLDGGLAGRFIQTPADVAPRLAAFDMAPDADGRFRVNECYCHDTTWQDALGALVQRSDIVLMDLRSFQAHNAGCRHELKVLAHACQLARVVVLTDDQTDRAVAAQDTVGAPAGRFVWLDTSNINARKRREVLESLFVADAMTASPADCESDASARGTLQ